MKYKALLANREAAPIDGALMLADDIRATADDPKRHDWGTGSLRA